MRVNWHSISFVHQQCGQVATISEVDGRADGHLMLFGYCPSCGDMVVHEFTIEQMIAYCAIQDHEQRALPQGSSDFAYAGQPS